MIYRLTMSALLLGPLMVAVASDKPGAAPVLTISFYAPLQNDPPVHIVGFKHNESEVHLVLSNASDKSVVGVIVGRVDIAPTGCALEPRRNDMAFMGIGGAGFELRIAPQGKAVASRAGIFRSEDIPPQSDSYPHLTGVTPRSASYPHYPKSAVFSARDARVACMQVQFGVAGVYFEDGTTWPAQLAPGRLPADPFDSKLVKAEAGKCHNVAAVTKALESIQEVVFEHESPEVSNADDNKGVLPHLSFSCSLEGPKAVCRLPLEVGRARASK